MLNKNVKKHTWHVLSSVIIDDQDRYRDPKFFCFGVLFQRGICCVLKYEDHKLPSVVTPDLNLSHESWLAVRHSLSVTRELACLAIRDPQVRSANQIQLFKSRVTTARLATRDPRLVTSDSRLTRSKSRVASSDPWLTTCNFKSRIANDESRMANPPVVTRDWESRFWLADLNHGSRV